MFFEAILGIIIVLISDKYSSCFPSYLIILKKYFSEFFSCALFFGFFTNGCFSVFFGNNAILKGDLSVYFY